MEKNQAEKSAKDETNRRPYQVPEVHFAWNSMLRTQQNQSMNPAVNYTGTRQDTCENNRTLKNTA